MKRFAGILVIGLLLFGGHVMAAQVTNVELSYQDFAVVARIDIEGQIRFTHETEVPKNGRPDRVIVDVLSATHELGTKNFLDLPECLIQSIRSSQYAVTPEKIVRIVFDLKKSPIYKVDVKDNSIYLYFTDSGKKAFATWSSSAVAKAKSKQPAPAVASAPKTEPKAEPKTSVAQKNKAIESDRMASLGSNKTSPAASPAPTAKEKAKPAGFNQFLAQTEEAPVAKKVEPAAKKEEPTVRKAKPVKKASDKKADAKADTAPAAKPSVTPKKEAPKKSQKEVAPSPVPKSPSSKNLASSKKSDPKAASQKPLAQKSEAASSARSSKPAGKSSAQPTKEVAQKTEQPKPTSTSRFRRSASNKIKGTLVAEFPKRLVVKYKSSQYRDPFKTLIDAARTQNNPVEQRIANVEGLKLVGIIDSDGGTNRALFEDAEGYGYMLKAGDKVRNGYVLRVETDRVYFQIFEYGWSRTVALKMD